MVSAHRTIGSWSTFHLQITKKSNLGPRVPVSCPKSPKSHPNDLKQGQWRVPKSTQNRSKTMSGPQGVLLRVASDPWVTQTVPRGAKMEPQASQISGLGVPNHRFQPASPANPATPRQSCKSCQSFQSCQSCNPVSPASHQLTCGAGGRGRSP